MFKRKNEPVIHFVINREQTCYDKRCHNGTVNCVGTRESVHLNTANQISLSGADRQSPHLPRWDELYLCGRELTAATLNGETTNYTYNCDGIRTSKTVDEVTTNYLVDGSIILAQNTIYDTLWFMYDSDGTRVGFTYHDDAYYYLKNVQSEMTGIVDSNLNVVVEYSYPALCLHAIESSSTRLSGDC